MEALLIVIVLAVVAGLAVGYWLHEPMMRDEMYRRLRPSISVMHRRPGLRLVR